MNDNKFKKTPLTQEEKEAKAKSFLEFLPDAKKESDSKGINTSAHPPKKEKTKPFLIRFPLSLAQDLECLSSLTGISKNATCLELLRPTIRQKLLELKQLTDNY